MAEPVAARPDRRHAPSRCRPDTWRSTSSDQIQVVRIATSSTTAKASASTSPPMLPRSHSQGIPGQIGVSERTNPMAGAAADAAPSRGGEYRQPAAILQGVCGGRLPADN